MWLVLGLTFFSLLTTTPLHHTSSSKAYQHLVLTSPHHFTSWDMPPKHTALQLQVNQSQTMVLQNEDASGMSGWGMTRGTVFLTNSTEHQMQKQKENHECKQQNKLAKLEEQAWKEAEAQKHAQIGELEAESLSHTEIQEDLDDSEADEEFESESGTEGECAVVYSFSHGSGLVSLCHCVQRWK
jgi:hypothetical protein